MGAAGRRRLGCAFDPSALRITTHGSTPDFDAADDGMDVAGVGRRHVQPHSGALARRGGATRGAPSYMASIAFTDEQVAQFRRREVGGLRATLVTLTSDHGQNLGEHNTWTKMTNGSTRPRPPIIGAVARRRLRRRRPGGMAELVDLYRTLADLGVRRPSRPESTARRSPPRCAPHIGRQAVRLLSDQRESRSRRSRRRSRGTRRRNCRRRPIHTTTQTASRREQIEWMDTAFGAQPTGTPNGTAGTRAPAGGGRRRAQGALRP